MPVTALAAGCGGIAGGSAAGCFGGFALSRRARAHGAARSEESTRSWQEDAGSDPDSDYVVAIPTLATSRSEVNSKSDHFQDTPNFGKPKKDTPAPFFVNQALPGSTPPRQVTGGEPEAPTFPGDKIDSLEQHENASPDRHARQRTASRGRRERIYGLGGYSQSSRVMLCMVGLPARGKSYISKMLVRYLAWAGFPVQIFNAGNYRRNMGMAGASSEFFRSDNEEAQAMREKMADDCMTDVIRWLSSQRNVSVAIFDATNTTIRRRRQIVLRCRQARGITPVFVESICSDPAVLEENYRLKMDNQDYANMDAAKARADFLERVKAYEGRYEAIEDTEGNDISYIKLYNVGQTVVMHQCSGYVVSHIGFFLSNIHIRPRSIWFTLHAESEDENKPDKITCRGRAYCRSLGAFLEARRADMIKDGESDGAEMLVLMGTEAVHSATYELTAAPADKRESSAEQSSCSRSASCGSLESAGGFPDIPAMNTSLLNEMDRGDYSSTKYVRIRTDFPELWAERQRDPLNFRYPGVGGESYVDVIGRLQPIIIELERQRRSVLVISHLAVQRCLYGYFTGCPMKDIPNLSLAQHTVHELRPGPYGSEVEHWCFSEDGAPLHSPMRSAE